ncbi:MAG: hypothetical protein AB1746_04455 [Candidatus Zixiibacteriota bacterium]
MDSMLAFARGPLFRFSLAIMLLGLARILILDLWSAFEAYRRAGDRILPWRVMIGRSLGWLVPIKRVFSNRPIYSIFSILFHIGLIIVPIFLFAHIELWKSAVGISWPALPYKWALWLTVTTIICALALLIGRTISRTSSFLSRKQDFLWPVILLIPFVTGFFCAHVNISPAVYRLLMLIHVFSADLIFLLIPFTKIAHCVIMPLSQFIATLAWKFPPDTDEKICVTLNKKGDPV